MIRKLPNKTAGKEPGSASEPLRDGEPFRSLIHHAPVAIGLLRGPNLIVEVCNDSLLAIWGRNASIIGLPLIDAVPEISGKGYMENILDVLNTGRPFVGEGVRAKVAPRAQTEEIYVDFSYTLMPDEDPENKAIIIIATEVTRQVKAYKQAEEAESSLRQALDLAQLATWGIDPKTGAIWYSDRMKNWIGAPEDERDFDEGMNPVPEFDRDRVRMGLEEAMKPESGGLYDMEHVIRNVVTGRERIIHAKSKVYFDEAGKPVKMIGSAQDVTEQRNMQLALEMQVHERTQELDASNEELQAINEELAATNEELAATNEALLQSNEALQQFAHVASHDLKEPLRKIKTFLGMIEADPGTKISETSQTFLKKVYTGADRMFAMISGVLAYSTMNASGQKTEMVDLDSTLHQICVDLEVLIAQKHAILRFDKLPRVQGAEILLYQLFYNLLMNSLKFTKAEVSPVITIESRSIVHNHQPFTQITVRDNGIGFAPEQADRIFHTFIRLNPKDKYEGTGLGLALCRNIVHRHGGTIAAQSIKGEGAEFIISLPMKQNNTDI